MRLDRACAKAIRQAIREEVGFRSSIEVGFFHGFGVEASANLLILPNDNDLTESVPLADVASGKGTEIESSGPLEGIVKLDCYLYTADGSLYGNCYVVLSREGDVLLATTRYVGNLEIRKIVAAQKRERIYAAAREACELREDTPLAIVADWLGDRGLYDLEKQLREALAEDEAVRALSE